MHEKISAQEGVCEAYMGMDKKRCTAVILAAGSGRRMQSVTAKQFMLLGDKPLVWYSLQAVERSEIIDDCILVTGEADCSYVRQEIVGKFGFSKVEAVIPGGSERCFSVGNAMRYIAGGKLTVPNREGYIFIHDGARPFLTEKILRDTYEAVKKYGACVAAVPSKDTVKITDADGFAVSTPDRRLVWSVQTPQVFETELITRAYAKLMQETAVPGQQERVVTDDASVVELYTDHRVKLVEASYENIKITTPGDVGMAEGILEAMNAVKEETARATKQ